VLLLELHVEKDWCTHLFLFCSTKSLYMGAFCLLANAEHCPTLKSLLELRHYSFVIRAPLFACTVMRLLPDGRVAVRMVHIDMDLRCPSQAVQLCAFTRKATELICRWARETWGAHAMESNIERSGLSSIGGAGADGGPGDQPDDGHSDKPDAGSEPGAAPRSPPRRGRSGGSNQMARGGVAWDGKATLALQNIGSSLRIALRMAMTQCHVHRALDVIGRVRDRIHASKRLVISCAVSAELGSRNRCLQGGCGRRGSCAEGAAVQVRLHHRGRGMLLVDQVHSRRVTRS
jgi:hypothetical protein